MIGTIVFEHDIAFDIVIARPVWHIQTMEDCEIWYNQWVEYLSKFDHKVDLIIMLDDFKVSAGIASEWARYRALVNNEFTRFSYRVNPDLLIETFAKTSGAIYNAPFGEAASVEKAYEAIQADRNKLKNL